MTLQVREGLFARTVVLCEGESEALSMEIWGKILKKDLAREGIAFVSSNGKFSLIDIAEFYSNLKIPVYLIFDSDIYKIQNKSTHAKHNKYLLKFSNGKVEDFPNTDINKNYCVLSPNFENVLRKDDKNYVNIEKEVDDDLGLEPDKQKGIRARFVALKYGELGMPPPKFIKSLIEAIIEFNKKGQ
jgi:predicted ATP-dependent endonuclease of OLD family